MIILAIDPGPRKSGFVELLADGYGPKVTQSGDLPNDELLASIRRDDYLSILAFERMGNQGSLVGKMTHETNFWAGRFYEAFVSRWCYVAAPKRAALGIYRYEVCKYLGISTRKGGPSKDSQVRAACIDRFPETGGGKIPQIGTKSEPGPLYCVSGHSWQALGLALTCAAKLEMEGEES